MSRRSVAVEIAGQSYRIRSDADEESLHRLAAYVDRAMERVRAGTGTVDSLDVAVLTCLNLAREILALRDQHVNAAGGRSLRGLIERIEAALPAQPKSQTTTDASVRTPGGAQGPGSPEPTTGSDPSRRASARALELPSVESLRERGSSRQASGPVRPGPDRSRVEPRTAAGGGGGERTS